MTPTAATPTVNQSATVQLERPIQRGEQTIAEVTLRAPKGGDLRGLSVQSLMQGDYNACRTLVPRIATPPVLETDFDELPVADVASFTGEIMGFFFSPEQKALVMEHLGLATPTG